MHLTHIRIDQFGIWNDLDLPLADQPVNVIYGPNEAGKTTLMRFVRGVLYGFQLSAADVARLRQPGQPLWSGSISLAHAGQEYVVRRSMQPDRFGGTVEVNEESGAQAEETLRRILQSVDRRSFEQIFTTGLQDIQQLNTLNECEAADFLYTLTLDADAKRLIRAGQRADGDAAQPWQHGSGSEFSELQQRRADIVVELEQIEQRRNDSNQLDQQRQHLQSTIDDMHRRRTALASELRGHEFLLRVWKPWSQVQKFEAEWMDMADDLDLPDDAEDQLAKFDDERNVAQQCADALTRELSEFESELSRLARFDQLAPHAESVRSFVGQREWINELYTQLESVRKRVEVARHELERQLGELGDDWTADRVADIDTSPDMTQRLLETADEYRQARARLRRTNRRHKWMQKTLDSQVSRLNSELREAGIDDLSEAITHNDEQRHQLQDLGRLQLQQDYLEQRQSFLKRQRREAADNGELPGWFHGVMYGFLGVGLLLTVLGITYSFTVSGATGAIFVLLGLTWLGVRMGLQQHYSRNEDSQVEDEARRELIECTSELKQIRQQLQQLQAQYADVLNTTNQTEDVTTRLAAAIGETVQKRARLEDWTARSARIDRRQERLAKLEVRTEQLRADISACRQAWKEFLLELGLSNRQTPAAAFADWQQIVVAAQKRLNLIHARRDLDSIQRLYQAFTDQLVLLTERIGRLHLKQLPPVQLLEMLHEELGQFDREHEQRERVSREADKRRRELSEYEQIIAELDKQYLDLFARCGATDRDSFEQRLLASMQREELEEQLQLARLELEEVAEAEPDLAIVEDDLIAFDREQCKQSIATLSSEVSDLDRDLRNSHEELGSLRQEIESYRDDSRPAELKFQLNQIDAELAEQLEDWIALQIAKDCVGQMCDDYERNRQPETLRLASDYLGRLTQGRYCKIWAPLGEQQLKVIDDYDQVWDPDQLSGGTREQLFVAIRLALVRQFANHGVVLPVILDDLLVNFDQLRTEAALETLTEFAAEGHQVMMFTCHLHLAHLFESRGMDPIWLPGHHSRIEKRRAS